MNQVFVRAGQQPGLQWLPFFAKRTNLNVEGPGRTRLLRHVKNLVGDIRQETKEVVRFVVIEYVPRPRRIDSGIDRDVGDMNTLGPQVSSKSLGEYSLRGLGRCKRGLRRYAA